MHYSNEFKTMLEKAKEEKLEYIGTGNPDAKILIIGKELAFDTSNTKQYNREIKNNISDWEENLNKQCSQDDVPNWEDSNSSNQKDNYNPLYPYKGTTQKEGHTWSKYQKLVEWIREVNEHEKIINFQKYVFITEYNINPSKRTSNQDKVAKRKSINQRNEFFKTADFFQQFPIVIVAAGDYGGKDFGVSLSDTFSVEYNSFWEVRDSGLTNVFIEKGEKKETNQWFSLHYNKERTKIVVHTRQLSSNISDRLLQEIANKVKEIVKEQKIELS